MKSRHYQDKNKEIIKKLETKGIKILDMTFKELILDLFDFSKKDQDQECLVDFKNFYKDIKEIDDNFYKEKKYHLIPKVEGDNGFIGFIYYVDNYCALPLNKREKLKSLMNYFKGKEINFDEMNNYMHN